MLSEKLPRMDSSVDVNGKRVLVRVDFNVPAEGADITDDFRILKTLPTLQLIEKGGGKLLLLSHLTEKKEHRSFEPILKNLEQLCGKNILLAKTLEEAKQLQQTQAGDWILLENLRMFPAEEAGDMNFAQQIATLGDMFVNEDFSQSHRPYATISLLPKLLPSYAGPLLVEEVTKLEEVLNPEHPFLFILGGAKFETKVGVLDHFLTVADTIFLGGAIANTFLKAAGNEVGQSKVENEAIASIKEKFIGKQNLHLPVDVVTDSHQEKQLSEVGSSDFVYDIGPESTTWLKEQIAKSSMVLWNGPMGFFEKGFSKATEDLLVALAESKAKVIIGGGDTMLLLRKHHMEQSFHHISTGGGAMLDFLAKGMLPGIEALTAQY
jgi:phosphoglycerate kinase